MFGRVADVWHMPLSTDIHCSVDCDVAAAT